MNKLPQRAVGVIVDGDRVLVMHRISGGEEYYVFPGGNVEKGETVEDALRREIKEEVNLNVENCREVLRAEDWGKEHVFFLIDRFSGSVQLGGEEKERMNEDDQYLPTWYSKDELKDLAPFRPDKIQKKLGIFRIL